MCVNKMQQRMVRDFRYSPALAVALLLAALLTGCTPDASGLGGGGTPPDPCSRNFDLGSTNIDSDPDSAGLQMEDPLANETFRVYWSYLYIGNHDWEGIHVGPYPFVTRVRIWDDGELVFEIEFDGEVKPGDFESDSILIEGGLPAGDYDAQIAIDTEGTVPECDGLPNALDNVRDFSFSVQPQPIDDLQDAVGEAREPAQVPSF